MTDELTREQHDEQHRLVELSARRSARRDERRDETALLARLYALPRACVSNVVPFTRAPEPPRAA